MYPTCVSLFYDWKNRGKRDILRINGVIVMGIIYNLLGFSIVAVLIVVLVGIIKPAKIAKITRSVWSRKKVAGIGAVSLVILAPLLSAAEPESVKRQRLQQQAIPKASQQITSENDKRTTKSVIKEQEISFTTVEREDSTLTKGERITSQAGVAGRKSQTYEVTYVNNVEVSRKLVKEETVREAVDEIILIGTYVAPVQPIAPVPTSSAKGSTSPGSSASSSSPSSTPSAYYANCTEARAAGVTPIYQGQPGYRLALDRDKDGIACER